jgi:hypothetical protein
LIEAVDKMLDQIGENEVISNSFMDYVDYSLENNERINLNKNLYDSAKEFVKDIHYEHLKNNKDLIRIMKTSRIRFEKRLSQQKTGRTCYPIHRIIQSRNIEIEDFAQGKNGIGGFFTKVLDFYHQKRPGFLFQQLQKNL